MSIFARSVSVGSTTPVDLFHETLGAGVTVDKVATPSHLIIVQNSGANPVRLAGENSVNSTTGFKLVGGREFRVSLSNPDRVFAQADINFGDTVLDVLVILQ